MVAPNPSPFLPLKLPRLALCLGGLRQLWPTARSHPIMAKSGDHKEAAPVRSSVSKIKGVDGMHEEGVVVVGERG